jgi:hypothetical protein
MWAKSGTRPIAISVSLSMTFCSCVGSSSRIPFFEQTAQAVGESMGHDTLLRVLQQLAKVARVCEHDVRMTIRLHPSHRISSVR